MTPAVGLMHAQPLVLPSCTLQTLAARVTGAVAGSLIRLGLYADNGNGYPGALLIDGGQVSGAVAGTVAAPNFSAVHPGGFLWAVVVNQTGTPALQATNNTGIYPYALGSTTALAAIANAQSTHGFTMAGVNGALPANFSATFTPVDILARLAVQIA